MTVRVDLIEGLDDVMATLDAFERHVDAVVSRTIAKYALKIEKTAKRNLRGGASGPRRIDTGFLMSSIHTELKRAAAAIAAGADYAVHVHFGTKHMESNTFLKSAFDEHIDDFIRELTGALMAFD